MNGDSKETKKKVLTFVNVIIIVCLMVCFAVTALVIYEYHRLDTVIPSGVLVAVFGVWGGELLIIAFRQVLGKDVMSKNKSVNNYNQEDNGI